MVRSFASGRQRRSWVDYAAGFLGEAVAIEHLDAPPVHTYEPLLLEAAQSQRNCFSSGTDEVGQVLVRQVQANLPALGIGLTVRFGEFHEQGGHAFPVGSKQNVTQTVFDPAAAQAH